MKRLIVGLVLLWSASAMSAGQVLSLETSCVDASSPEACASNLYMSLNIKPGIGDEARAVDMYFAVIDSNGNLPLVFTETGWQQYTRGPIAPYYLVPRAIDPTFKFEPLGTGADVSNYFGYGICWGYGRRGTRNGNSLDDLTLRGTYQCWELTRFVNAVKRMSVLIRNPGATGGEVRVINDSLSSSGITIVPMGGQTFSVTVTPPTPPLGYRVITTVRINGVIANHYFAPNGAMWYGTESRTGYFSSIQQADDLLEVTSELEAIPLPPPPTFTLTVNSLGASAVVISSSSGHGGITNYAKTAITSGTSAVLTAPSTSGGNDFAGWSGCSSVSGTVCTASMTGDRTVTVTYSPPPTFTLTVNSLGASAVVISSSSGHGGITNYAKTAITSGTGAVLTAPSTSGGNDFAGWSGCSSVSGTVCTASMTGDRTVTVAYSPPPDDENPPPPPPPPVIYGCMDPAALNYDPTATSQSGITCTYPPPPPPPN